MIDYTPLIVFIFLISPALMIFFIIGVNSIIKAFLDYFDVDLKKLKNKIDKNGR